MGLEVLLMPAIKTAEYLIGEGAEAIVKHF
jgi:hypothetical protein